MTKDEMIRQTQEFALRVFVSWKRCQRARPDRCWGGNCFDVALPWEQIIGLLAAAKSKADFINKLKIVEEECDETIYWMELIVAAKLVPNSKVRLLSQEANELLSIVVAAIRTSRANRKS